MIPFKITMKDGTSFTREGHDIIYICSDISCAKIGDIVQSIEEVDFAHGATTDT